MKTRAIMKTTKVYTYSLIHQHNRHQANPKNYKYLLTHDTRKQRKQRNKEKHDAKTPKKKKNRRDLRVGEGNARLSSELRWFQLLQLSSGLRTL